MCTVAYRLALFWLSRCYSSACSMLQFLGSLCGFRFHSLARQLCNSSLGRFCFADLGEVPIFYWPWESQPLFEIFVACVAISCIRFLGNGC